MNYKIRRLYAAGKSLGLIVPPDWARGNGLGPGSEIELWYDGFEIVVRPRVDELPEGVPPEEGSA